MWQYITDHQYHKCTLVWELPLSSLHAMENAVFLFKLLLQVGLILVFLNFFGIASWKRYNDEDVYISCTEQYSNNIRPPGITICPGLRNRYHNILANPCSSKNGTLDIVSCIEEASFSLSDVVLDVRGGYHDQGEDDQLDASEWTQDFAIETILKIMTN